MPPRDRKETAARHRIIVVDDDRETCALVKAYIEQFEFSVATAAGGAELRELLKQSDYELILLDVMLPRESGFDICRSLRADTDIPIIMLTAVGNPMDRVVGLELGADDYVAKPFEPRELLARIRAAIRRRHTGLKPRHEPGSEAYRVNDWSVEIAQRKVETRTGAIVSLTFAEFELLTVFLRNAGKPVTRSEILDLALGRSSDVYDRSVDVLVSRLRSKLSNAGCAISLTSIRGLGYMLSGEVKRI